MRSFSGRRALLALWTLALWVHAQNTTLTSSEEEEDDVSNLEELELELEQQPERRGAARSVPGWSSWSDWSPCSRSCDGGASFQLRRCDSPSGCRGDDIRHKICNMQPCPESGDFRLQQCIAFNDVPYDGQLLSWTPHYDDNEPCALTCRGRPRGEAMQPRVRLMAAQPPQPLNDAPAAEIVEVPLPSNLGPAPAPAPAPVPIVTSPEDSDEASIVMRLAPKVQDGTRCRPGSLDMCINGKCQRVGCDLRIGSFKKVDACGVCGGDGSSCARPLYRWGETPLSLCSASCGGGRRMLRPVCQNAVTGDEVDDQLCNASSKPDNKLDSCNNHPCPPKWVTDDWGPCSVSCGGGQRFRYVHCAEDGNGTRTKVADQLCHGHRPHYQEQCNLMDCPTWNAGEWSGVGSQTSRASAPVSASASAPAPVPAPAPAPILTCRTSVVCAAAAAAFVVPIAQLMPFL